MIKLLTFFLLMNMTLFFMMKTPLSMGFMLMIQTILMSMISGMMSFNFWYAYILFMIMIGGMLILFIYISSLSSNLKFNFNKNFFIMLIIYFLLMMTLMISNFKIFQSLNSDSFTLMNMENEQNFILKMSMNKLYNPPTNLMMILMINYLLFTLFIVVKIININLGPLRKNF